MSHEYQKRQEATFPGRSELDQEALRFIKSWHRHPALQDLLWYRGINLGEVDEFDMFPEILELLVDRAEREGT